MKVFQDVEKAPFFNSSRPLTMNSRTVQGAILTILLIFFSFSIYTLDHARIGDSILDHYKDDFLTVAGYKSKERRLARRLHPEILMQRPLATDLTSIPKLFHQSWINDTLPSKFEEWSTSCRLAHSDWEWVLWSDEDNLKLIERHAPWFLDTYDFLRSEIFRADTARNVYMHVFGGVYADLDTECLLPYDSMFEKYNVSTVGYSEHQAFTSMKGGPEQADKAYQTTQGPSLLADEKLQGVAERKAFVGRMGVDDSEANSIPNAWMASTPGHPFWILPMEASKELSQFKGIQPEEATGPVALYDQVNKYNDEYLGGKGDGGTELDKHYAKSGWRHLYKPNSEKSAVRIPQSLVILPPYEVFPYSWQRDGYMYEEYCSSSEETFDAGKCKQLMGLEHWGSHSITYWSHSWSGEGNGHWDEHLAAISKSSEKDMEKLGSSKAGT